MANLADREDGELELVSDWNEDEGKYNKSSSNNKKKYKITVDGETEYYYIDDDGQVTDEDGNVIS